MKQGYVLTDGQRCDLRQKGMWSCSSSKCCTARFANSRSVITGRISQWWILRIYCVCIWLRTYLQVELLVCVTDMFYTNRSVKKTSKALHSWALPPGAVEGSCVSLSVLTLGVVRVLPFSTSHCSVIGNFLMIHDAGDLSRSCLLASHMVLLWSSCSSDFLFFIGNPDYILEPILHWLWVLQNLCLNISSSKWCLKKSIWVPMLMRSALSFVSFIVSTFHILFILLLYSA